MDKKGCLYTVIKYIPDPVRNEPRNIGIIVQSSDFQYINCKFLKNLQAKLVNIAAQSDIKVIKAYIDEFSEAFRPFVEFSQKDFFVPDKNECLTKDYLFNLASQGLGKIQFSEPRGCLTDNPENELEYLYGTFVGEELYKGKESVKQSRLKTEIKRMFKNRKLLFIPKEQRKGFEIDMKISGGRSKVEHLLDFGFRNGKYYLVETVDMRRKVKKDWASETYEAVMKFDDLKHGLGEEKIAAYSIVALPQQDGADHYLKILNAYSKVFRYSEERERKQFISHMHEVVDPPVLFHKPQKAGIKMRH